VFEAELAAAIGHAEQALRRVRGALGEAHGRRDYRDLDRARRALGQLRDRHLGADTLR
jgi:hypothetical protein